MEVGIIHSMAGLVMNLVNNYVLRTKPNESYEHLLNVLSTTLECLECQIQEEYMV